MAKRKTDRTPAATLATNATRGANEWGIPDWRDRDAYSAFDDWELDQWRWEFLRRDPEYREDFLRVLADKPWEIQKSEAGEGEIFEHALAEKYGTCFFYSPKISAWGEAGLGGPQWSALEHTPSSNRWWQFHSITFDLGKPLAPQLQKAKENLEFEQSIANLTPSEQIEFAYGKETPDGRDWTCDDKIFDKLSFKPRAPRHHHKKWPSYLRVLDAREAGASWSVIAAIFYNDGLLDRRVAPEGGYSDPPPQAARDLWLQARALRF